MTRHVVITGMGGMTAFGGNQQDVSACLLAYENAVRKTLEWQVYDGLHTPLGAPVGDFTLPEHYTRKRIRAMGHMSQMSTCTSELVLEQTGLISDPASASGETSIAYGSSTGSTDPVSEFAIMLTKKHTNDITGTTYVQMMPHTIAINTGLFFGLRGRVIPTFSTCALGSQATGYAWETIRHSYQTVMVVDDAEELCPSEAAVLDTLFATSQHNDAPRTTPSPFDENRDGLVTGEGAGALILEELEHVKTRSATIYGEIVGFAANCDTAHITQPQCEIMQCCMEQSLEIAGLGAQNIDYIPAYGTAIDRGDMTESLATVTVYGGNVPISSLESYLGHTLGACGALEAWMSL